MTLDRRLFVKLFVVGLIARLAFVPFFGVHDMHQYIEWGGQAYRIGLANANIGIYFPIQIQIFQMNDWIAQIFHAHPYITLKMFNLLFDIGTFIVLRKLLKGWKINPVYSLIYWLHPWFVLMFGLGYIDFQFTFFVLLAVLVAEQANTFSKHVLAGIPLGIALLMKPQALALFVVLSAYLLFKLIVKRKWQTLGLTLGPAVLFIAYSLFFYFSGKPLAYLWHLYLKLPAVFPAVNANMLNIWYPIAYFMKNPQQPIYAFLDTMLLAGIPLRTIAAVVTATLSTPFVFVILKNSTTTKTFKHSLALLFGFIALIFPMLMTQAHENHLFLGTVLLIPLIAQIKKPLFRYSSHLILLLMFLNIFRLYGFGENLDFFSHNLADVQRFQLIGSFAAIISFLIVLFYVWQYISEKESSQQ